MEYSVNRVSRSLAGTLIGAISSLSFASGTQFDVGEWQGKAYFDEAGAFHDCSAGREYSESQSRHAHLMIAMDREKNVGIVVFRVSSNQRKIPSTSTGTVLLKVDDLVFGTKNAESLTSGLLIKAGKEPDVLLALQGHSVLTIDTGNEVLKFALADAKPLFSSLDACVRGAAAPQVTGSVPPLLQKSVAPNPTEIPTEPGPNAVPVIVQSNDTFCASHRALALYRPELEKTPTRAERQILLTNAQQMEDCIPVWRSQCAYSSGSVPGLNNLCEANADATAAFVANARLVAVGKEGYSQYNTRSELIENQRRSTETTLFNIAQEYIDNLDRENEKSEAAAEKRAAIQRQEETNALLRQLISQPPPRPTFTNCNSSGDGSSVQCQTY